jgi:hypothetical protein
MARERAHELVGAHRFDVTADEGMDDLARRYGSREPFLLIAERVLVARGRFGLAT